MGVAHGSNGASNGAALATPLPSAAGCGLLAVLLASPTQRTASTCFRFGLGLGLGFGC
jgi:hypothetical protein